MLCAKNFGCGWKHHQSINQHSIKVILTREKNMDINKERDLVILTLKGFKLLPDWVKKNAFDFMMNDSEKRLNLVGT